MHQMCQKYKGPTIAIFVYYYLTLGAGVVVMWKLHKSWYSCKLAHLYGFLVVTLWSVEVFGAIDVRISGIIFEIMGELAIVEDSVVPEKTNCLGTEVFRLLNLSIIEIFQNPFCKNIWKY